MGILVLMLTMKNINPYIIVIFITANLLTAAIAKPTEIQIQNSIKVITNIKDKNFSLSKQQIRNIFMGNPVGHNLKALVLEAGNINRVIFNTKVIGLTESRIQSYWVQMRFSGRKKSPKQFSTVDELVKFMQHTPKCIAYVPTNFKLPEGLNTIYQTGN